MPDIVFVNSPKSEDERLKMTAKIIGQGFYARQGFVVLPTLDKRVSATAQVIYPRAFEYKKIDVSLWEAEWRKVEQQFWAYLGELLPSAKLHGRIEVRLTRYGTVASGAMMGMHDGGSVIYYLRSDVDLSQLAAMIINKIIYAERKNLGITWSKREALMDFVMTRPGMKKLFPKYEPVFAQLSRVPKKIREESEVYVRRLGIAPVVRELERVGAKIWIKGSEVGRGLTKMEKKVLGILIDHKSDLVTYDELADTLWGVGEFKTYWAINKVLERLRLKLRTLGVVEAKLESVRGQGYILS